MPAEVAQERDLSAHGRCGFQPRNDAPLLVLGVDTSLRSTGLGLVEHEAGHIRGVAYDLIRNPSKMPLSAALLNIQNTMASVIEEFKPDVVAVEGFFFSKFPQSAMILGQARGVVIASAAKAGLAVFEHEPRRVKQAVAGFGGASKEQMQRMVVSMLGLEKTPPEDAADALAIAICHIQAMTRMQLEGVKAL